MVRVPPVRHDAVRLRVEPPLGARVVRLRVVTLARKPLASREGLRGTVAENLVEHGVGALHVDPCRIACEGGSPAGHRRDEARANGVAPITGKKAKESAEEGRIHRRGSAEAYFAPHPGEALGRWPANLVLVHLDGCRRAGTRKVRPVGATAHSTAHSTASAFSVGTQAHAHGGYRNEDGTEEVDDWACVEGCPVKALDGTPTSTTGVRRNLARVQQEAAFTPGVNAPEYTDEGGASRFFKHVKA